MINQLIGKVGGVDIWYIISLVIFITFFVGVTFYVSVVKASFLGPISYLPFEEGEVTDTSFQKE